MLPVAVVNSYNQVQASLINTPLPDSAVSHVPPDNVAPPISNAQVNNNTTPNNEATAAVDEVAAAPAESIDGTLSAAPSLSADNQPANGQTAFLTQLISQDGSPPAQIILGQYDKLVAYSTVKYKPSDALRPPAPANMFGQILQQSKPVAPVQQAPVPQPPQVPPPSQPTSVSSAAAEAAVVSVPVAVTLPLRQPTPPRSATPSSNSTTATGAPAPQTSSNSGQQAAGAYATTASRIPTQAVEKTLELV